MGTLGTNGLIDSRNNLRASQSIPRINSCASQLIPRNNLCASQLIPRNNLCASQLIPGITRVHLSWFPGITCVRLSWFPGITHMRLSWFPDNSHASQLIPRINPRACHLIPRNRSTSDASNRTKTSHPLNSTSKDVNIRSSTWVCWRTSGSGGRGSRSGCCTLDSCTGERKQSFYAPTAGRVHHCGGK